MHLASDIVHYWKPNKAEPYSATLKVYAISCFDFGDNSSGSWMQAGRINNKKLTLAS